MKLWKLVWRNERGEGIITFQWFDDSVTESYLLDFYYDTNPKLNSAVPIEGY